jgi:hypothetical protein
VDYCTHTETKADNKKYQARYTYVRAHGIWRYHDCITYARRAFRHSDSHFNPHCPLFSLASTAFTYVHGIACVLDIILTRVVVAGLTFAAWTLAGALVAEAVRCNTVSVKHPHRTLGLDSHTLNPRATVREGHKPLVRLLLTCSRIGRPCGRSRPSSV